MPSLFLINPGAGRPRNLATLERKIMQVYGAAKREVEVKTIDFSQLDNLLEQAAAKGTRRIFAVGGDGTVNAVGSRLIGTSIHFGIIPLGSGNGYARNAGFSIKTDLAIAQSLNAKTLLVDTGQFAGYPFLNVCGVGLDAQVAKIFAQNGRRGLRPYIQSTADAILHMKAAHYGIVLDGESHSFPNCFGVVVANGQQWGYDAKVSGKASITDGAFDIMVVKKFSMVQAGILVSRMFNGTLAGSSMVTMFRGREVTIQRDAEGPIQVDGEPLQAASILQVSLQPQSLHLLIPNTLTTDRINRL